MASNAPAFDVGDYVVYPKHGVGRVVELQIEEMRQIMQQQALQNELQQAIDETKSLVSDVPNTLKPQEKSTEDHDRPA